MPTAELRPAAQILEEVGKYLWNNSRINLTKRQCVGGPSKYNGLLIGRVSYGLIDDALREFTLEEISIGITVKNFDRLHISPSHCAEKDCQLGIRDGKIDKDTIVHVISRAYDRFIVSPMANMIDYYSVCSWEPMRDGIIRVHSLHHFKELLVDR